MLKPLKNKVIVKTEEINKTKGGLMIASNLESDNNIGIIAFMPDECKEKLCINDRVIFSKFSGSKIKYNDTEYIVIDVDSILAIIKEE